jgi:LysM repeat protein
MNIEEKKQYVEEKIKMEMKALEPPKSISFRTCFWIVLALHLFGIAGIMGVTQRSPSASASVVKEDKAFIETKDAQYTGVENPTPTPTPTPQSFDKPPSTKNDWPTPKPIPSIYFVNNGDTLYSIAKKYNLSVERIKTLNQIKDVNKIKLGQKIKLK